jgi:hypothetical protein
MVRSEGGIASCCADQEAAVFPFFDSVRKPRDIDQALRALDRFSKKVDQTRAASKVLGRVRSAEAHSLGRLVCAGISEGCHAISSAWLSAWICAIASTMPL